MAIRNFLDLEFTGLHKNTTPISIGIVDELGNKFYAEFTDYDKTQINDWLQKNVMDNLILTNMKDNTIKFENHMSTKYVKGTKEFIKKELDFWYQFIYPTYNTIKIDIWSDCLAYDWVLFNDIFADYKNGYPELPKQINYIPFDICTLFKIKGIDPDISREEFANSKDINKHNSLHDANVIMDCYNKLIAL